MNKNLIITRKEKGMYQREVAGILGISKQSYCHKETGKTDFTQTEMLRLARIFNCTLDELFGGGIVA